MLRTFFFALSWGSNKESKEELERRKTKKEKQTVSQGNIEHVQ